MSPDVLLLIIVCLPCTFVLGVVVGYARGRNDAERDLVDSLIIVTPHP